jgi:hypothetical protein
VNRIASPPSTGRKYGVSLIVVIALAACTPSSPASISPTPAPTESPRATPDPSATASLGAAFREHTLFAAGDIASCSSDGDEATAALLDDLVANCYVPTWGRHLSRTLPNPGNHEYNTADAAPYFAYFGGTHNGAPTGWYELPIGPGPEWWLISLNSNCDEPSVGGCGPSSHQGRYLAALLDRIAATTPRACILAFWHHPRWSSGSEHGPDRRTDFLWRSLADAGADVVLAAHDHVYERFVPMNADGQPDGAGPTQFIVGTGGKSLYDFARVLPTSAARDAATFGVLQLTLREGVYDWAFIPTLSSGFTDAGSASCR